jgi:hypothetical protein
LTAGFADIKTILAHLPENPAVYFVGVTAPRIFPGFFAGKMKIPRGEL